MVQGYFVFSAVASVLFVAHGVARADESLIPADTGLAQRLRQQIASSCFGFVDHDPSQIRGYEVRQTSQLTRDGYPWGQFEEVFHLLTQRKEVLVGGSGSACGDAPPGGMVNLVTRREAGLLARAVVQAEQFGGATALAESSLIDRETLRWRMAARQRDARSESGDRARQRDWATQVDLKPQAGRLFRLDLDYRDGDEPSDAGWPLETALIRDARHDQSLEQSWSRYHYRQLGMLLAWEENLSPTTLFKFGYSRVRYIGGGDQLFFSPTDNPPNPSAYAVVAYRIPSNKHHFDALHVSLEKGFTGLSADHLTRVSLSRIALREPENLYPAQSLGIWRPGQTLPEPTELPADASRWIKSVETRVGFAHSAKWPYWHFNFAGRWTHFADDNGVVRVATSRFAPMISLAWMPDAALRVQWSRGRGYTGGQFAPLSSAVPERLQSPEQSREDELGVRWNAHGWQIGMAAFSLSRPYRYEWQAQSYWRGDQSHRGWEAIVGWKSMGETLHVVFTGQTLNARVQGVGDENLDNKRPPGIPAKRASLFGEWKLSPGSPWSFNAYGEYQSSRMTFDDNRVLVPGFVRWDLGVDRRLRDGLVPVTVALTVRNVADRRAWEWVGGGVGYLLAPRMLALTMTAGGS